MSSSTASHDTRLASAGQASACHAVEAFAGDPPQPTAVSAGRPQLFRQEALDARSSHRPGAVMLARPIGNDIAAGVAAIIIALVCCFAWFGTYTRKATVSGVLSPSDGVLRIVAPASGLVTEVLVKEGQLVAAGDVLFKLSGERISSSGATQKLIGEQLAKRQALLVRNARLAEERYAERLRGSDDRLNAIENELGQLATEAELLNGREQIGQAHVHRQEESVRSGFISQAAMDTARSELMALQGQQQALGRAKAALERDRASLRAARREATLQFRSEASEVEASLAAIAQEVSENDARSNQLVKAPFAATVSALSTQAGHLVPASSVLATLIPADAPLVAHLYAISAQTGFIATGQPVSLRYHAFPYQKFGMAYGKVLGVTRSPYAPQELPAHVASALGSTNPSPVYRITVQLNEQNLSAYGNHYPLSTGMTIEADIFQDRRRLYEWALEPVYAVARKIG